MYAAPVCMESREGKGGGRFGGRRRMDGISTWRAMSNYRKAASPDARGLPFSLVACSYALVQSYSIVMDHPCCLVASILEMASAGRCVAESVIWLLLKIGCHA